ncbi:MAG: cell envelope integrity protein TolA, partial [Alphaproteobacteria bacterium]
DACAAFIGLRSRFPKLRATLRKRMVKEMKTSGCRGPARLQPNSSQNQYRSQPMTMSEIDAIRYQIQQCWSIPAGARDAENLVVRIKVFLNSDGSLSKAPEIVGGNGASDPFYRTAAESARRAILKCSPLKNLPAAKYARWREITLTFNPRDMLGG